MKLQPYNKLGICPDCSETKNIVMVEIPEVYDGGLYWQCLHCPTAWHRWPEDHYCNQRANKYIEGVI